MAVVVRKEDNALTFQYFAPAFDRKYGKDILVIWKKLEYKFDETLRGSFLGLIVLKTGCLVSHYHFWRTETTNISSDA